MSKNLDSAQKVSILHISFEVKKCSQFRTFTTLHLKKVAQCFAEEYFQEGSMVIKQGDIGSRFYIIKSGSVSIRKDTGEELAELTSGESFGELSLLDNKARNAGNEILVIQSKLWLITCESKPMTHKLWVITKDAYHFRHNLLILELTLYRNLKADITFLF